MQKTTSIPQFKDLKMVGEKAITHTHKTTALVGILSGIIPCPSAIAAFFMAGQVGKPVNLVSYVLLYIIGFTVVMLILAFIFTVIGVKLNAIRSNYKILDKLDLVSACLIIAAGTFYLFYNSFSNP